MNMRYGRLSDYSHGNLPKPSFECSIVKAVMSAIVTIRSPIPPKKVPRLNARRGKLVLWQQATGTGGNSVSF